MISLLKAVYTVSILHRAFTLNLQIILPAGIEGRPDPLRALLPSCPVSEPRSAEEDPSNLTHQLPLLTGARVNSEVWGSQPEQYHCGSFINFSAILAQ